MSVNREPTPATLDDIKDLIASSPEPSPSPEPRTSPEPGSTPEPVSDKEDSEFRPKPDSPFDLKLESESEYVEESDEDVKPKKRARTSPKSEKKPRASNGGGGGRNLWTAEENACLLEAVDRLVAAGLQSEVKKNPMLAKRGVKRAKERWRLMSKRFMLSVGAGTVKGQK